MTAQRPAAGTVRYLVPLPVRGRLNNPLGIEPVARILAATRGVQWSYVASPDRGQAQTGILVAEHPTPWNLVVAVEASELTGGFVLVSEPDLHTGTAGTALVYAGQVLRAWRRDSTGRVVLRAGVVDVPSDADTDSFTLLHMLTGRTPGLLHPSWALASGVVSPADQAETAHATGKILPASAGFTQVVLDCDEDRWRSVLDRHGLPASEGDGWRWRLNHTPEAEVPFIMLRGPCPLRLPWVAELASATDGFTAAAEVRSQQNGDVRLVPWVWADPGDAPHIGDAENGVAAVEVWRDITTVLGSHAAALDWPATDPGHPLVAPGDTA